MKELLELDSRLKRLHKYKILLPGTSELPEYLIKENKNPDFYVQFDNEGLKIHSLNSKSIDKNIEGFYVILNKRENLTVTVQTKKVSHFLKTIEKSYIRTTPDKADLKIEYKKVEYYYRTKNSIFKKLCNLLKKWTILKKN